MALIRGRMVPVGASASRFSTRSATLCFSLIHSTIGQESRTRVFKFALLFSELQEVLLHAASSAPETPPGIAFRQHDFLPSHFERELGARGEVEGLPNLLGDGDLAFGGDGYLFHESILP